MSSIHKDLNGKLHFKEDALPDCQRERAIPKGLVVEFNKINYGFAEGYIKYLITSGHAPNFQKFHGVIAPLNDRQLIKLHNRASEIFAGIYAQMQSQQDRTQDLKALEKRKELAKKYSKAPGIAAGLWVVAFRTAKSAKQGAVGAAIVAATAAAYTYLPYYLVSLWHLYSKIELTWSRRSRDKIQEFISDMQDDRKEPAKNTDA